MMMTSTERALESESLMHGMPHVVQANEEKKNKVKEGRDATLNEQQEKQCKSCNFYWKEGGNFIDHLSLWSVRCSCNCSESTCMYNEHSSSKTSLLLFLGEKRREYAMKGWGCWRIRMQCKMIMMMPTSSSSTASSPSSSPPSFSSPLSSCTCLGTYFESIDFSKGQLNMNHGENERADGSWIQERQQL